MTPAESNAIQTADTLLAQAADLARQAADQLKPHRHNADIYQAYALIPHSSLRLARTWLPNGHPRHSRESGNPPQEA